MTVQSSHLSMSAHSMLEVIRKMEEAVQQGAYPKAGSSQASRDHTQSDEDGWKNKQRHRRADDFSVAVEILGPGSGLGARHGPWWTQNICQSSGTQSD